MATEDKPRVRKSRKDGLWIAELPVLAGGVLVGWYSERFDRQEFALSFASRGPIRRDPESHVSETPSTG
jgi:hypothetical protein